MSITTVYSVFCDVEGCSHWAAESLAGAAAARREAKSYGWRRINGKDVCPRHTEIRSNGSAPKSS